MGDKKAVGDAVATRKAGVILATPEDSVGSCLDRMAAANVGSILITQDGRPVGILTERDVLRHWRRLAAPGADVLPVSAFLTAPVYCLTLPELAKAPQAMLARRIRHVPLVGGDGRIIGIISMRDVLAAEQRSGTMPKLTTARPSAVGPPGVLHVLQPTAELAAICRRFLPANWRCRIWQAPAAMLAAQGSAGPQRSALLLDLDGLAPDEDWRPLIRGFIAQLGQQDRPALFLVSSPPRYPESELALLKAVAAKARWHVYQRPLPVSALAQDLRHLNDPPPAKGKP